MHSPSYSPPDTIPAKHKKTTKENKTFFLVASNHLLIMDNLSAHNSNDYDKTVIATIPYYEFFHRETINLVHVVLGNPSTWLDTGCGTGFMVSNAIKSFPETKYMLADPSPAMIKKSREKLSKCKQIQEFYNLPTQELPKELSGEIDVVTAIMAHHYINARERRKATQKCYELLKDNGLYITFENIKPETPEGARIGLEYWRQFQLKQKRNPKTVEDHLKRYGQNYFPLTLKDHIKLLKDTGFNTTGLLWKSCMQAGFYAKKS
jgi:tRNA (cmo5U34)-methyltransferase